jgi:hypothetical protein
MPKKPDRTLLLPFGGTPGAVYERTLSGKGAFQGISQSPGQLKGLFLMVKKGDALPIFLCFIALGPTDPLSESPRLKSGESKRKSTLTLGELISEHGTGIPAVLF